MEEEQQDPSASLSLLRSAIDTIVSGKPYEPGFQEAFVSAVGNAQKKWDAIEALLANHQMGRVGRIYALIEGIEDKFLNPTGLYKILIDANPEFALEVFKALTKEGQIIADYVEKKKFGSVDTGVIDTASRERGASLEERAKALPASDRQVITRAVQKLKARGMEAKTKPRKVAKIL